MPKRRQIIEIFAPTEGIKSNTPSTLMPPRAQPYGLDSKMYYGINQKEYGTTIYATGSSSVITGAPINFMFEARYPNSSVLQVFTHTGVYKYSAGGDGFVSDGQVFTGTTDDYWTGVMHNDQFFYNNGIDNMQYKASVSATGTQMTSAVTTSTYKCWCLQSFREHLNLYHTIENGSEYFKRVRWTKKGVLSPSATDDFVAGTAGAIDVQDCEGGIQVAVPINESMAVYSDRSIHIQDWVGDSEVYRFQKVISGVGTPSRRGAISYKNVNYFVGYQSFYSYHGGTDLRDIGEPIKKIAFANVNNRYIQNSYMEVDERYDEILFHVPTGTAEYPNTVWVYNINYETWTQLSRPYLSNAQYTRKTGLTIGELVGNIGAQNFTFGDASISVEALVRIFGDTSGRVVKSDLGSYDLSISGTSTAQSFVYETPDLTGANVTDKMDQDKVDFTSHMKRWSQVNVEMLGNGTAYLSYSTDKGVSYVPFSGSPITLTPTPANHTLDVDVEGKQFRVKITNTATGEFIGVKYVGVEFIPGSEN